LICNVLLILLIADIIVCIGACDLQPRMRENTLVLRLLSAKFLSWKLTGNIKKLKMPNCQL